MSIPIESNYFKGFKCIEWGFSIYLKHLLPNYKETILSFSSLNINDTTLTKLHNITLELLSWYNFFSANRSLCRLTIFFPGGKKPIRVKQILSELLSSCAPILNSHVTNFYKTSKDSKFSEYSPIFYDPILRQSNSPFNKVKVILTHSDANQLNTALFLNQTEKALVLISSGALNLKAISPIDHSTYLINAFRAKSLPTLPLVKELLMQGIPINAQESIRGNTALHFAAMRCATELFKFLIENGADDNIENNLKTTPRQFIELSRKSSLLTENKRYDSHLASDSRPVDHSSQR